MVEQSIRVRTCLWRRLGANDSRTLVREWLYNRRSELASAQVGANAYGYTYDTIGNRLTATDGNETKAYTSNELNQYTSIASATRIGDRCQTPVANPVEPDYDADGNLTNDGRFDYLYDDENRLVSAYPISPAANDLAVENFYDHLHRRIQKTVYQYVDNDWTLHATHTFGWDGMNIVLERIVHADNTTRTCEYYRGPDRSGTEQGAGGVEGLLAVSIDGTFYFPIYGDNANIVGCISETGTLAAQYVYDPYGNITETYGPSPDLFAFGFSTKYHDRELGLIAYQRRFYVPEQGRWLNRDPIEEKGGVNMYQYLLNASLTGFDYIGLCKVGAIRGAAIVYEFAKSENGINLDEAYKLQKQTVNGAHRYFKYGIAVYVPVVLARQVATRGVDVVQKIRTIKSRKKKEISQTGLILKEIAEKQGLGFPKMRGRLIYEQCECTWLLRRKVWRKKEIGPTTWKSLNSGIFASDSIFNVELESCSVEDAEKMINEELCGLVDHEFVETGNLAN